MDYVYLVPPALVVIVVLFIAGRAQITGPVNRLLLLAVGVGMVLGAWLGWSY